MTHTLMLIAVLFVYPTMAGDVRGAAWAYCLGIELASGLALVAIGVARGI